MKDHYALTGALRYYRTLPRQVELRTADTVKTEAQDRFWVVSAKVYDRNAPILAISEATPIGRAFNLSLWKDPPHVALANLHDNPAAALRFTRTYGVLAPDDYVGEARTIPVKEVLGFRHQLRLAWGDPEKALLHINVKAELWLHPTGLEIIPKDLWTLIRVIFARDFWDGRTKKCESPDCPAPYFLAVRKGQKFCSQKCAVLINVRHFREREARRTAKSEKQVKHNRKGGE